MSFDQEISRSPRGSARNPISRDDIHPSREGWEEALMRKWAEAAVPLEGTAYLRDWGEVGEYRLNLSVRGDNPQDTIAFSRYVRSDTGTAANDIDLIASTYSRAFPGRRVKVLPPRLERK